MRETTKRRIPDLLRKRTQDEQCGVKVPQFIDYINEIRWFFEAAGAPATAIWIRR